MFILLTFKKNQTADFYDWSLLLSLVNESEHVKEPSKYIHDWDFLKDLFLP